MALSTLYLFFFYTFTQVSPVSSAGELTPEYVWPLGNTSVYSEVIRGRDARIVGDGGCFRFGRGYPGMPYDALKLTGAPRSAIEIVLDGKVNFQDLALSFHIYPEGKPAGTILSYRCESGDVLKISLMEEYFFISFWDEYGVSVGTTAIPNVLAADTWSHVVISRDYETGTLKVFHDSKLLENLDDDFPNEIALPVVGSLRIGGSHDPDSEEQGFVGRVVCFQIYSAVPSSEEVKNMASFCQPKNWKVDPGVYMERKVAGNREIQCLTEDSRRPGEAIKVHSCDLVGFHCLTGSAAWKATMRKNKWTDSGRDSVYFRVASRDLIPDIRSDQMMAEVNATDRRVCWRLCMRVRGCSSFVVSDSTVHTNCFLFKSIENATITDVGSKYYTIQ